MRQIRSRVVSFKLQLIGNETADETHSNALLVQLLLSLDRKDLATSTFNSAKKIGNDSMLIQAMEAWIGLKQVSRDGLHASSCMAVLDWRNDYS